ncbi:MAG: hypothetical protein K2L98_02735, partial [Bacilli bacterium]|nr:hypothetical protein [Bacilli bacterium]
METQRIRVGSNIEPWQSRALKLFTKQEVQAENDLLKTRKFFQDNFDANYISAMKKIFGNLTSIGELDLTKEEIEALLKTYPKLLDAEVKGNLSTAEEEYYALFLKYIDNASRYCTKLAELARGEHHEYQIVGIERVQHIIVKEYGEYVYSRASSEVPYAVCEDGVSVKRDFEHASRRLCCLEDSHSQMGPIIDLDLYRKYLGYKGIKTSVDYDTNTFIFGTLE